MTDRGRGASWLPYTPAAVTSSKEITTQMTLRPPNLHRKETQTAEIWSCLPFIGSGQNHLAMHSERGKLTRQTEEEMGRQHRGMARPGVRQVPEGSGDQGKWRKLVAKSSVVSHRPSRLRD